MNKNDILSKATIAINGSKIKELRNSKGLTQLYIATEVGVVVETVSKWEKGTCNIKNENAEKLAAAIGVSVEEIRNSLPKIKKREVKEERVKPFWSKWLLPVFLVSVFLAIVLYLIINPPRIIIQLEDGRILIKTSSSNDDNMREHRLGPKLCAGTKF